MAHKYHESNNKETVTNWDEDDVTKYVKYLRRRGHVKTTDDAMTKICETIVQQTLDGETLWNVERASELKPIVGDKFKKEWKKIHTHLRKLKNPKGTIEAPCEFRLDGYKIVKWQSKTVQQFIATIEHPDTGEYRYNKYFDRFEGITGDILLHMTDGQDAALLEGDPFCIDDVDDCFVIWKEIEKLQDEDYTPPDQRAIYRNYDLMKKAQQETEDMKTATVISAVQPVAQPIANHKHPKEWSAKDVAQWICGLEHGKYAKYKERFIAKRFDGANLTMHLNETDLQIQCNIRDKTDRRGIVRAVQRFLQGYDAKSPIVMKNGLIITIAIAEYDDKECLFSVQRDVKYYRDVLAKRYGYKLMSSVCVNDRYHMNREDVLNFIAKRCIPELIGPSLLEPKLQYDGLLVALSGHGTIDSLVCSDGKKIKLSEFRDWFKSHPILTTIPRFFCVDACRVKEAKETEEELEERERILDERERKVNEMEKRFRERNVDIEESKQEETAQGPVLKARGEVKKGPSTTIMGQTEGNIVIGGKVAKYLCAEWRKEFENAKEDFGNPSAYNSFRHLYQNAYLNLKLDTEHEDPQPQLVSTEWDMRIDNVVFVPKEKKRSGGGKADGTDNTIDDDLAVILLPQAGGHGDARKDLTAYFFPLRNAGFKNNERIVTLTKEGIEKLESSTKEKKKNFKLKMKPFDKAELCARVNKLKQTLGK
eukprot:451752_1